MAAEDGEERIVKALITKYKVDINAVDMVSNFI